jgi:hypothetical protein
MRLLFPSQQADEKIYMVIREHWLFLFLRIVVVLILFSLLIAFQTYGPGVVPGLFTGTAGEVVKLISQLYVIILVFGLFTIWTLYYLNTEIVTDIRIVDIDQNSLFSRLVSELHIDKIEDVTSDSTGPFATIFQYGNVYIQTAGATERFQFERIPDPEGVKKMILDLYEKRPPAPHP